MPNKQLLPLPVGHRDLSNDEVRRLKAADDKLWADWKKTCLTCQHEKHDGVKTFRTRERGQIVTYDCTCLQQWKLNRWLLNSGVDLRYQRLSWDDTTDVDVNALTLAMGYLENASAMINRGLGFTMWSEGTGTGKTLLVTLILKTLMARGVDGYFTQFNEMLNTFVAGWKSEEERKWFIQRISNAGVLVIDDLGRESKGRENITESMIDAVIRARVGGCKPTFITTNYTEKEILQGYGHNILSLLSEVNEFIEVRGTDYRPTSLLRAQQDARDGIIYPIVAS